MNMSNPRGFQRDLHVSEFYDQTENLLAIDNSIYALKSLNSESYQLNSDKLWPNDIFKSNNQYKEVERFSNSSPEDVFQQDDESSTIKTTASENTTSCKSS
uniref:Uncharacterized protein n=1 Tax=Trichobilharzia regenti TaxID=157069 RepID=A0AA85J6V8_TRIRE